MRSPFVLFRRRIPKFRTSYATQFPAFPVDWLGLMLLGILSFLSLGVSPVAAQSSAPRPIAARPDSLLRLSPARRYAVIAEAYRLVFNADTNAGKRMRKELEAFFQKKGTEKDRFHLQMALLQVHQHGWFHPETLLDRATGLLRRAEAEHDTMMLIKGHLNVGEVYFHIRKAYYPAFRHFGYAFDLLRHQSDAGYPDRDASMYKLARASYDFFDYEKTIEIGRTIHPRQPKRLNRNHIFNACLLGMAHLHRQRYDSARTYFEWGLRQLPLRDLDNEAWVGIFSGDLGWALAEQGQREAALPYLKRGLNHTIRTQLWDNVATFGGQLARLHLRKARLDSAGRYARLAHESARRVASPKFLHETHQILATYYERVGRASLALRHADSAAVAKDQWQTELNVTLKHRAEMVLEAERHQARERLLQEEKDRQVLLRNGLLLVLLLAVAIAWLLYIRQVVAARHRQERARAAHERSEAELRLARAQLDQYLTSFREKNELIGRISTELAQATDPSAERRNDRIAALLESVILTDADWQHFRQVFDQVHPGFFEGLRRTHPKLTPAEVRLVALSKLGVPTREMAGMLGVSTDSVHKGRYRLRRKLESIGADEALLTLLRAV